MPELPEVEVTRLGLADRLTGARIQTVCLGKPLRWPLGVPVDRLRGQVIRQLRRRGKYLLLDLDEGLLLVHLGMSGHLRFDQALPAPGPHDHVDLWTDRGVLRLHDPRRFGAVVFAESESDPQARKLLGRLGVEPLTDAFDPMDFHRALKTRRGAIKQVLLAGDIVVGVGNIYAAEALFWARIRPMTKAHRLSAKRVALLHAAIRRVLTRALDAGGSTLRDFANAEGGSGYFQLETMVYGRAGEPCRVCGTPIQSVRQGQRSTFFCPTCQKN
jgi:formamidopyrimidine-DNA glycosylase